MPWTDPSSFGILRRNAIVWPKRPRRSREGRAERHIRLVATARIEVIAPDSDRDLVERYVERVVLAQSEIKLDLRAIAEEAERRDTDGSPGTASGPPNTTGNGVARGRAS